MTKKEIIDIFGLYSGYSCAMGREIIEDFSFDLMAQELLAKFEQEKKEQAREILQKVNRAIDQIDDYDSRHTAKLFIAEIAERI